LAIFLPRWPNSIGKRWVRIHLLPGQRVQENIGCTFASTRRKSTGWIEKWATPSVFIVFIHTHTLQAAQELSKIPSTQDEESNDV
jgi:hypothetical protein